MILSVPLRTILRTDLSTIWAAVLHTLSYFPRTLTARRCASVCSELFTHMRTTVLVDHDRPTPDALRSDFLPAHAARPIRFGSYQSRGEGSAL